MSYPFDCADPAGRRRGLEAAVAAVQREQLVVLPVETRLRRGRATRSPSRGRRRCCGQGRRGRDMPPPVLVPSARTIDGLATDVPDAARALAEAFWPGAAHARLPAAADAALGPRRQPAARSSLRMPVHPLALELLDADRPARADHGGADRHGRPAKTAWTALDLARRVVDVYLDAGPAPWTAASTIVDAPASGRACVRLGAVDGSTSCGPSSPTCSCRRWPAG